MLPLDLALVIWTALAIPQDPSLRHLDRFPPVEVAEDSLAFCCLFRERMWEAQGLKDGNAEFYGDLAWQADFPRRAWDALCDANNRDWTEERRRGALGKLRGYLGDDAWWAAKMPFPLPLNALRDSPLRDRYWRGE